MGMKKKELLSLISQHKKELALATEQIAAQSREFDQRIARILAAL